MTMKTFKDQACQGDVMFRRCDSIPNDAQPLKFDGPIVIAKSETHHDHAFPKGSRVTLFGTSDPLICFLRVEAPSVLEHQRAWDTHMPILFPVGVFEIRRQKERAYTPAGWKRVED